MAAPNPRLADALAVYRELGWHRATVADAPTLPLGTSEQRKRAREGLKSGPWRELGRYDPMTQDFLAANHIGDIDESLLVLFAIRVGVAARRAATVLLRVWSTDVSADVLTAVVAERGPTYAATFVDRVCTERGGFGLSRHALTAVTLVDRFDLPVPDSNLTYARDWSIAAAASLGADLRISVSDTLPPAIVERRFAEHARAAVALSVEPHILTYTLAVGVERGLLSRDETIDLAIGALDAASGKYFRRAWVEFLTRTVAVADAELLARSDALLGPLAHGEPQVVEAFAPTLIAGVAEDQLIDVLTLGLAVVTKKAKRAVLKAAAARRRPGDATAEFAAELLDQVVLQAPDLGPSTARLRAAWHLESTAGDELTAPQGLWRSTPQLWQVPRFAAGPVTPDALTAAAAMLTSQEFGFSDVHKERFLALVVDLAATSSPDAVRAALAGLPGSRGDLVSLRHWLAREERPWWWAAKSSLAARNDAVVARLGELPTMLSTPSWDDLRVDAADLAARLDRYAAAGIAVAAADLTLALLRTDPATLRPAVREALAHNTATVRRPNGSLDTWTAGRRAAAYLADSAAGLAAHPGASWDDTMMFSPVDVACPRSLHGLGIELRFYPHELPAAFPLWRDAAWCVLWHDDEAYYRSGRSLRQLARSAHPLAPASATALLAALRSPHPATAEDVATAVSEAWERGLLLPGAADISLLDGRPGPPRALATLAVALRDAAQDGLASVVWPVLADLTRASAEAPKLPAGTLQVVTALTALLPEARAAVAAGIADPSVLDLPGVRTLAARSGSSQTVVMARKIVADLPEPTTPQTIPAAAPRPVLDFATVWPSDLGTSADNPVDAATFDARWLDPDAPDRRMVLDVCLPAEPGISFRVLDVHTVNVNRGAVDCARVPDGSAPPTSPWGGIDTCLVWDRRARALRAIPRQKWLKHVRAIERSKFARLRRRPLLSTTVVAALLATLASDTDISNRANAEVIWGIRHDNIGTAAVRHVIPTLLAGPDLLPHRLLGPLSEAPETLPVLWPILTESVRAAAQSDPLPRWLGRVLEVALTHADTLAEAARRGLIPAADAAWPGLADIAARSGVSATLSKARGLHTRLGDTATSSIGRPTHR